MPQEIRAKERTVHRTPGHGGLRGTLERRRAMGAVSLRVSIVLRRELSEPFAMPVASVPLSIRPFRQDDVPFLFPAGADAAGDREREDVAWRLRAVSRGWCASECFVALDERSGDPCHIQWLTKPGYGDGYRRVGDLPTLGCGEAMLENAYTPRRYRGLGIMPVAICLIAERAAAEGFHALVALIDADNPSSLKGAHKAGLSPCSVRTVTRYCFGLARTVRFHGSTAAMASRHEALAIPPARGEAVLERTNPSTTCS